MTGFYCIMQQTGEGRAPYGGSFWIEFFLWTAVGFFIAYSGERAKTYIERKNKRWRQRRKKE